MSRRYRKNDDSVRLRTQDSTISDLTKLLKKRRTQPNYEDVKGVKGLSPLLAITEFDIIRGCPVDYMHSVLLGVVKHLFKLWFHQNLKKKCSLMRTFPNKKFVITLIEILSKSSL